MSAAGQANEAGSVARRSAATYFGVHMLATRPVEALENYRVITHVAFESSDPTDDVVLTFEGDGHAFVSSKRKVTYGKPFTDTVDGWVAQLDENLGDNDLLVLVCEEASEWVRDLADALAKLRAGVTLTSRRHLDALKRLDEHVPADKRDEIHRRARLVELPRTATSNDVPTLLALMMDELVEGNAGALAVSVISATVHEWAGRALGFDATRLVRAVAARDIVVRADESGPAAAQAAAARAAEVAYLDTLASSNGRIDLTLLADDLQPIVVKNLLANVRVQTTDTEKERGLSEGLWVVLRRNRRILLVGQPGSGKSVLMRELAGACAEDPYAPTPIPVHLPDLLPRHTDHDVTIEDLVVLASRRGPKSGAQRVEKFLTKAIAQGDAILLLDGLDECRDRAAWLAGQLRTLMNGLPETTAVVLATRASAEVPAAGIGLARVDLVRPGDLDATVDAVVTQCAKVRVADLEQRRQWLRTRREWLADASHNQPGMLEVPQLALLVALIIGSTAELEIPKQRAELLHEAVRQSVKRWEHDRFSGARKNWARDLTPATLLDGFVVLGRLIDGRDAPPSRSDASGALSDMLADPGGWNLSVGKARELADQVLTFWDTHVAVFVLDEDDRLRSRSRVFTEIATAMWTKTCSTAALREWVADAIRYYDSEGVVSLALSLNPSVVDLLLELGESATEATLAVAASSRSNVIELSVNQVDVLIRQLGQHARQIASGAKEPPTRLARDLRPIDRILASRHESGPESWPVIDALCSLTLNDTHRHQREQELSRLTLKPPSDSIVTAWVALEDALSEKRPLDPSESEAVKAVLALELPEVAEIVKVGGVHMFTNSDMPHQGLGQVAHRAVKFLPQLQDNAAQIIYDISDRIPSGEGGGIKEALRQAGVDTSQWEQKSPFAGAQEFLRQQDYKAKILDDVASLGDTGTALTKNDRWSLQELSDLLHVTGYLSTGFADFRAAFEKDDVSIRRKWLRSLAVAHAKDIDRAAAEAAIIRAQMRDQVGVPLDWWVVSCRSLYAVVKSPLAALSADDQDALVESLHAISHWISWSALYVLANTEPSWDTVAFFNQERTTWPPYRASECYFLSLLVSPEGPRLAAQAAESSEAARRHAVQRALQYRGQIDPMGDLAARLSRDDDLWVRGDYSHDGPAPRYWTCRWCGHQNAPTEESCANCGLASRPSRDRKANTD
ncbi:NACHT domain-containing protein [Terrabacter sp. NPDC000476]|uniref:NACHT domain-containing protein n=1 Tax=Terrabacter sp. NPDC000476 TaxID=3154258 RepID=UPI003319484B